MTPITQAVFGLAQTFLQHLWPFVSILVLFLFRKGLSRVVGELAGLLTRTDFKKLSGKWGDATVEVEGSARAQKLDSASPLEDRGLSGGEPTQIDTLQASAENNEERSLVLDFAKSIPAVQARESIILDSLRRLNFELRSDETTTLLIRQLAFQQTVSLFERAYRLMWGSQLELLTFLNARADVPESAARVFYSNGSHRTPAFYGNYSYEQWRDFPRDQLFLAVGDGGVLNITNNGRWFLTWIAQEGLTFDKAG